MKNKNNKFFSPINGGIFENLTFKKWFMSMQRLGLMLIVLFFIGVVQFKAFQGEFDGERSSYCLATGITLLISVVFVIGTLTHWKRLREIAKRTSK